MGHIHVGLQAYATRAAYIVVNLLVISLRLPASNPLLNKAVTWMRGREALRGRRVWKKASASLGRQLAQRESHSSLSQVRQSPIHSKKLPDSVSLFNLYSIHHPPSEVLEERPIQATAAWDARNPALSSTGSLPHTRRNRSVNFNRKTLPVLRDIVLPQVYSRDE